MGVLSKTLFSGVFYTAVAKYTGIVVSIIISAILARLLPPEDFGVIAIATIFINFFSILTTVGISPAIVQNKSITEIELRSINTFTFLFAFVISLLYVSSINIIVSFYDNNSDLTSVMRLLTISVFFSIASITPNAMIMKNKLFKFIAIRTFAIQIFLGIISVICAYSGLGIYSLLINPIGSSLILFVVSFLKNPVGFYKPTKDAINKILSFSVYQSLFNFVYLLYRNIDKIIVSKTFGLEPLGYYEKSYRLMMLPLENISSVISPVLHPVLSDYQNEKEKVWTAYLKMISTLSEVSFIISVALFYMAGSIILILYGENWRPSIPIFQILSLSIAFQVLQSPIGAVMQSINKVKALFWGSVWILLFVTISIIFAVIGSQLVYVAIALDISFIMGFIVYQYYIARYFQKRIFEIFDSIKRPLIVSILFWCLCFFPSNYLATINIWVQFGIYCFITLLVYYISYVLGLMPNTKELFCNAFSFKHK